MKNVAALFLLFVVSCTTAPKTSKELFMNTPVPCITWSADGGCSTSMILVDAAKTTDMFDADIIYLEMEKWADYLRAHPKATIRIEGYTYKMNSRQDEGARTERIVQFIKNHIEQRGVAGSRMETVAYGADNPIAAPNQKINLRATLHLKCRHANCTDIK